MTLRRTHTYAVLEVSDAAYQEIKAKLQAAGYDHAFMEDGEIDMFGIAVVSAEEVLTNAAGKNTAALIQCANPLIESGAYLNMGKQAFVAAVMKASNGSLSPCAVTGLYKSLMEEAGK